MSDKIERLAAALAVAWRDGGKIALPEAADAPASRAETYAVQDRIAAILGERVVGWKVGAAIAAVLNFHPAIELAGSRYVPGSGGRQPRTHDVIADNGGGGAFVFGPAIADWRGIDFDHLPIDPRIDGGQPIQVYSGELRRDPVVIAAETVNDLGARGFGFKAGDYLSTGSLSLPTPIAGGQKFVARFGTLATLSVVLV